MIAINGNAPTTAPVGASTTTSLGGISLAPQGTTGENLRPGGLKKNNTPEAAAPAQNGLVTGLILLLAQLLMGSQANDAGQTAIPIG
ncbi:MAG: hypothetical protein HEQ32_05910 [Vampirovibrio sp.]